MSSLILSFQGTNKGFRLAVGVLFLLQGACFASWASRIPGIQQRLDLSDASLGFVLLALPVGSLIGLPFSAWLVTKFGSKKIATNALLVYGLLLMAIGFADNVTLLLVSLGLFGIAGNVSNIAINTQAVGVEEKYGKNIMASFHGLWSLAGFAAAGIGAFMIAKNIMPFNHFIVIATIIVVGLAASFQFLIPDEKRQVAASSKFFAKPDKSLVKLGVIAFCCMICEGAMFDWSGIYFQKVVQADERWVGAGYIAFMSTMAMGRFVADRIVSRFGFKTTIQFSGLLITTGLLTALLFPSLIFAIAGFFIVGFGVSSVIPLVYSEAGRSKIVSPGIALASVSSVGFLGFLVGPPLIGIVAGVSSLRVSFFIIALIGILIVFIVGYGTKKVSATDPVT